MQTRTEKDSLGERLIPVEAYYGINTDRAVENFRISGLKPKPAYVEATVQIKKAAAKVNMNLGFLTSAEVKQSLPHVMKSLKENCGSGLSWTSTRPAPALPTI